MVMMMACASIQEVYPNARYDICKPNGEHYITDNYTFDSFGNVHITKYIYGANDWGDNFITNNEIIVSNGQYTIKVLR
jgi:hypothetical protein